MEVLPTLAGSMAGEWAGGAYLASINCFIMECSCDDVGHIADTSVTETLSPEHVNTDRQK